MSSSTTRSPVLPSETDIALARVSARVLAPLANRCLRVQIDGCVDPIEIPAPAVRLLVDLLVEMAAGNAVALIPVEGDLTLQKAADFLGVSRPFLIGQLDAGKMSFHKVGTHLRIHLRDVMAYKHRMATDRRIALDALSDQDLGS